MSNYVKKYYRRDPNGLGRGAGVYYNRGHGNYSKCKSNTLPTDTSEKVTFESSNGKIGSNFVEVPKEIEIEGFKCVMDSNGDLHKFNECAFVVGFECPDCGELYEEKDAAGECCCND